jgi:hypothetical protein
MSSFDRERAEKSLVTVYQTDDGTGCQSHGMSSGSTQEIWHLVPVLTRVGLKRCTATSDA